MVGRPGKGETKVFISTGCVPGRGPSCVRGPGPTAEPHFDARPLAVKRYPPTLRTADIAFLPVRLTILAAAAFTSRQQVREGFEATAVRLAAEQKATLTESTIRPRGGMIS